MSQYVIPQVEVFQDFQISPAAVAFALNAHVAGGHAQLVRYNVTEEQANGHLGTLDFLETTSYAWPNLETGGIIDNSYVELYCQNALLNYYEGPAGGGSGVVSVAGYPNRVRSPDTNWTTNGDYAQDASLLDRGVKVGDIVQLIFSTDPAVTVWSYAQGLIGDAVASIVGAAAVDPSNAKTSTVNVSYQQTHGPWNAVEISAASASAYNPYPTGQTSETYTIVVIQSSVDGDFATGLLRVVSASGLDDVASVAPSDRGHPTPIGSLGATVTFNILGGGGGEDASESADDEHVSPDDLLIGQRFTLTVKPNFTAIADPTSGGSYAGSYETTYIVTVTTGSTYAGGVPQIKVSTSTGVDASGPTNVTAAGVAIPIGTFGVTATFHGAGLVYGDRYTIPVTPVGVGPMRTIVLGNSIPSTVPANTTADITLFIRNPNLLVPQNQVDSPPLTNYTVSPTEITVSEGLTAFDPTWTDDGVQVPLPVESYAGLNYGTLFVQYRAWLPLLCGSVGAINDVANLTSLIPGPIDPDNPLSWAVQQALNNSNGSTVYFTSVCDPDDVNSWAGVLELLLGNNQVYGLVPLTKNPEVWQLYQAHVDDQSTPENGMWRVAWFSLADIPTVPIVSTASTVQGHTAATTTDGNAALATIQDDPNTTGTQYTIVTVVSGNATFITNGVQPGDLVYALFTTDGFGDTTHSTYIVNEVLSEETLQLVAGPSAPVNTPSMIQVWRNLTGNAEATAIATVAGAFADRRIRCVWPDTIASAGTTMEGYFLCAALAGLRSGILPQQGMTNLAIKGFDSVPETTRKFNQPQLNIMGGNGVWIVTQQLTPSFSANIGEVYTRDAVTTGLYTDLNQRQEMVTSNVDSISFQFLAALGEYIGVVNVTPSMLGIISIAVQGLINNLKQVVNPELGGQLIDGTIVALRQHLVLKDRIVCILSLQIPYSLDVLEVHLVVPAATITATTTTGVTAAVSTPTTTG